jgi:DNA-binding XRE family transcriptional regulator
MVDTGSSVPRRQLGRYLKLAREEAGIALDSAAKALEFSRARMYRIEGGHAPVRSLDVEQMCRMYGATPELTEALVSLAKESKARGWWQAYGDAVPDWFELYVGLEAAANRLRHYEPALVPGLLQNREYAAAVFETRPGATEAEIGQAVALRMERQKLLTRRQPRPPALEVILDEAVLRRPIADRDGMRAQLAHLVGVSRSPNISVRVLPSVVGPHRASVAGAFVILDFPAMGSRQPEPTTVYSESLTGALYLDRPSEVNTYYDAWQTLDGLALGAGESGDLITAIIKETLGA